MTNLPEIAGRRRWLHWLIYIALLAAIPVGLLFILPDRGAQLRSQIQARIDGYKNAGSPITAREMARFFPPVPNESNSVLVYQQAIPAYVPPVNIHEWPIMTTSDFAFRTKPWPQITRDEIADCVSNNQNTLALLHQAALLSGASYPAMFTNGFLIAPVSRVATGIVQIRAVAQFLAVSAVWQAEEGRPDRSEELLVDSLALPRSLESNPELVMRQIGVACYGLSCSALELALNKTAFSDAQLRRLSDALESADPAPSLANLLLIDRCKAFEFRDMLTNQLAHPNGLSLRDEFELLRIRFDGGRERDFLAALAAKDQYLAATKMPYPLRLETVLKQRALNLAGRESRGPYAALFVMDWDKVFVSDARTETMRRMAQTAIALERFRLANQGNLPADLSGLVPAYLPAAPIDAYTGRPLGYKKFTRGYELHSPGSDAIKGSGVDFPPVEQVGGAKTSDLMFTVER